MTSSVHVFRFRSRLALAIAAIPAAYAWFALAWRVVLGSTSGEFSESLRSAGLTFVPDLPEWSPAIVWSFFVLFGVALPVFVWTRVATVATGAGQLRIEPAWGRALTISIGDVVSWHVRGESLELRIANRRPVRLRGGYVAEVANVLDSSRRSAG